MSQEGEIKTLSIRVSETEQPRSQDNGKTKNRKILKLAEEIKIGKLLILVASLYIFLTVPHNVDQLIWMISKGLLVMICNFHLDDSFMLTGKLSDKLNGSSEIFSAVAYLMLTCNYSFNFYFYCLINQDIRKTVIKFMKRIKI